MSEDTTEQKQEEVTLYCMDCGQMLDRKDERCFSCGAYQ